LWGFLTVASVGFALTLAGLVNRLDPLVGWGMTTMAFATLVFLFIQFWTVSVARTTPPAAPRLDDLAQRAVNMKPLEPPPQDLVEFKVETVPKPARPEGAWPEATQESLRRQRAAQQPMPTGEFELPPAFRKRQEFTKTMPIVRSVFEGPEEEEEPEIPQRPGKTRGQCSSCQTYIWAPKKRPIKLRCPKCGKVALLKA
jgi:hypothetical protein